MITGAGMSTRLTVDISIGSWRDFEIPQHPGSAFVGEFVDPARSMRVERIAGCHKFDARWY
jgi:hypothetical protein